MNIRRILVLLIIVASLSFFESKAEGVIDTSPAEKLFSIGVRLGFNTGNTTFPNTSLNLYNNNSWGLGFTGGVVANINIKEYISIQPGFFFDMKSGGYSYLYWYNNQNGEYQEYWRMGHSRNYNMTVPVMAVVKFDINDNMKFTSELGPYFQYKFKETGIDLEIPYQVDQTTTFSSYIAEKNNFDAGVKIGGGILIRNHFYFGAHYLAGFAKAWKVPQGGHNKEWTFTIGYDF